MVETSNGTNKMCRLQVDVKASCAGLEVAPNKVIKNKRMKLDPLVDLGEKADIAAPCVRTWLLMDSIHEEEYAADWRLKLQSPQQEPSQKLKQMEWNFGQKFAPVPVEEIPTKKAGKPKTGKLTKKEQKELFTTNQKLSWGKADMSSQLDQEEVVINIKSQPTGQSIPNNKLIKSYKKSSNANKKNNRTQNQIKTIK